MCFRVRHDFGLPDALTEGERNTLRREMRRLYEEVAGYGYFNWTKPK